MGCVVLWIGVSSPRHGMDFNFVSSQIWFSRERNRLCGGDSDGYQADDRLWLCRLLAAGGCKLLLVGLGGFCLWTSWGHGFALCYLMKAPGIGRV
ncbi:hypothetical protein ISN45_Aa04g024320 [Arabidopsis thaliana x Arabidopsis arenosa]|uniref:Uncharacterized protein n=1 Tax=Arabidopsis thaliana x Arabidopsis arenosa TaxID=1240361 RepID=A0A8T2ADP5_9BRAS|nr:hypothetical protein ISN45_Aa04g024320 [Arabidopsis thaliana x Arabidopsis arenosa]